MITTVDNDTGINKQKNEECLNKIVYNPFKIYILYSHTIWTNFQIIKGPVYTS
jgi:hypothetical protein